MLCAVKFDYLRIIVPCYVGQAITNTAGSFFNVASGSRYTEFRSAEFELTFTVEM